MHTRTLYIRKPTGYINLCTVYLFGFPIDVSGIWLLQTILGDFQKEQQKFVQEKNARRTGGHF